MFSSIREIYILIKQLYRYRYRYFSYFQQCGHVLLALTWLKYSRYGVKSYSINQYLLLFFSLMFVFIYCVLYMKFNVIKCGNERHISKWSDVTTSTHNSLKMTVYTTNTFYLQYRPQQDMHHSRENYTYVIRKVLILLNRTLLLDNHF